MNTNRRRWGLLVAGLFATVILSSTGAPAWADDDPAAKSGRSSCWLNADTGVTLCFASDAARTQAIAGPPSFAARAVFTLAYLYENSGFGGASLFVSSGSATFCATGSVNQSVIQAGWDNRISSLATYNGCSAKLYDGSGLTSLMGTWSGSAASLGGSDNRTSSYQIT